MKMLVIIYVFGYGFLKIIEHLTDIDKVHIERAPGNCPYCNKPYVYVSYHNNYIEYRCSNCGWMDVYEKNKNGRWKIWRTKK